MAVREGRAAPRRDGSVTFVKWFNDTRDLSIWLNPNVVIKTTLAALEMERREVIK